MGGPLRNDGAAPCLLEHGPGIGAEEGVATPPNPYDVTRSAEGLVWLRRGRARESENDLDGALLAYLDAQKRVDGRGVEISQTGVNSCVAHGLSVIQGDADTDLKDYPSDAFDYVILSQTLQATHNPKLVVSEMVRIGRRWISFSVSAYRFARFEYCADGFTGSEFIVYFMKAERGLE